MSIFMKKRTDRVIEAAESIIRCMVPQAFGVEDKQKLPYRISTSVTGNHILIDVESDDPVATSQLVGRGGASAACIRKILVTIALQEGLRITFDIVSG